ncbi:MAG: hypothetical protein IJ027_06575 [Oscillospiraceae bacterium]|nr:hypothetical protein [Oscillospiraceae bacterium]
MTLTEKAAYLKGLASGLALDETKPETKLINALIDLVDDIALTVADIDDELAVVVEQVDLIDEDLESLEEDFYEDDEEDDEDELIKITCPNCDDDIYIDDAILNDGELQCPNCGETLEFDLDCCDCDCDDCDCCEQEQDD